ncbi:MAG: T9SS type A sorting domain-containing protein [bacterium]
MKYLVLLLVSTVLLNIIPIKAQSISPIKADTVFAGYDSGVTSSLKIVNHGTSIIYNHDGKLYEMSALTYKLVREIVLDELNPVTKYDVDDNCKYIFYNTKLDTLTFVADYYTGKTIKTFQGSYFLTKDNIIVKTRKGNWISVFTIMKTNDFNPIDTFYYGVHFNDIEVAGISDCKTVYDKNIFLYKIHTQGIGSADGHSSEEWYKIDPVTLTPGKSMLKTENTSGYLFISKSGKYNAFYYSSVEMDNNHNTNHVDTKILILDTAFKNINSISENDLKKYYNDADFSLLTDVGFLNDRYMISSVKYNDGLKIVQNVQVYDIERKKAIKHIDFENYTSACYNDKFILSNKAGCFVTLTLEQVPVVEENKSTVGFNASYSNNNLILQSVKSESVDMKIINITGEVVELQNCVYLNEGSNTFQLNNQLANGLYFCIIKTPESIFSRKFMVIK